MTLSRRRFLTSSTVAAAHWIWPVGWLTPEMEAQRLAGPSDTIPPPATITGELRPLFRGQTARPLRYRPSGRDFVIRNGGEFFNRPLYGKNNDFRLDGGDRPEFSLWLPGHGGNLRIGIETAAGRKWLLHADEVVAHYRAGRLLYEVRDELLGAGRLQLEVVAGDVGLLAKIARVGGPASLQIIWAFAGADGRRGRRNGDIGCELIPVSEFFQVRERDCEQNLYTLLERGTGAGDTRGARLHAPAGDLALHFPADAELSVERFSAWDSGPSWEAGDSDALSAPVLCGLSSLHETPIFLAVRRETRDTPAIEVDTAAEFGQRAAEMERIAMSVQAETPDPYVDAALAALGPAADFLWHEKNGCVMHGDVAWRTRLAGWRGPYCLDALGHHERAQRQFRHWIAGQNVTPVTTGDPATGPADPKSRLARKEHLLHSNGDLSGNHYDMNLVFFDVLFRHLRWTGDAGFAREAWPAIQRHLAWEHRLFRREFEGPAGERLPLYEAYAAIWASDNLQYSGGGVAHATAYNLMGFRSAATLAATLGEDAAAYAREAEAISRGLQSHLWMDARGLLAESKDLYGPQTRYDNPALWTVYHAIDSEAVTPRQAWQMIAERLGTLPRVPVHGEGVEAGPWFMLATSNWTPYLWSLTLLVLAENMHMALAMWQAGMRDEAFSLFKGNLLDSMYMGLCPGDLHMTSALDPHRQEAQRDFGDPIGITSRAFLEGLFGLRPNLMEDVVLLRPGFPSAWNHASLKHPDFEMEWKLEKGVERFEIRNRLPKQTPIQLCVRARATLLPRVLLDSQEISATFDGEAVGEPMLLIVLPAKSTHSLTIHWSGEAPAEAAPTQSLATGDFLRLPKGVQMEEVDDPQGALRDGRAHSPGTHTVFARMEHGACRWSMPISFQVKETATAAAVPMLDSEAKEEPLDLTGVLTDQLREIFATPYAEPRSPFCSLSVPDTLVGGWSNLGEAPAIDDAGLRAAKGVLRTPLGVSFRTPAGEAPNCRVLSFFAPHASSIEVDLSGRAEGMYLLVTGTTLPQCSRMQNALATVTYLDGSSATLPMRNPETWWPIEQDYMIDDYLFPYEGALPPRVDLATGHVRLLERASFQGKGGAIAGGAATMLYLKLDPRKTLQQLKLEVCLYPVVLALLGVTLVRPRHGVKTHGV